VRFAGLICALLAVLCTGAASSASPGGTIGGRVLVSPIRVDIDVPDRTPKAGTRFNVRAHVTNDGSTALNGVAVRLVAPAALVLYDPVVQTLPRIGPGGVRSASWKACSAAAGNYVVLARATLGASSTDSTSAVVGVREAKRPTC
jgi:hypothetical protein